MLRLQILPRQELSKVSRKLSDAFRTHAIPACPKEVGDRRGHLLHLPESEDHFKWSKWCKKGKGAFCLALGTMAECDIGHCHPPFSSPDPGYDLISTPSCTTRTDLEGAFVCHRCGWRDLTCRAKAFLWGSLLPI